MDARRFSRPHDLPKLLSVRLFGRRQRSIPAPAPAAQVPKALESSRKVDPRSSLKPRKGDLEREARQHVDELRAQRDLPGLVAALKEGRAQAAAAQALATLGDSRAVPPLGEALIADDDYLVRRAAAMALGELGYAAASEELLQALDDPYFAEWEEGTRRLRRFPVREEAARSLALLCDDRRVADAVLDLIQTGKIATVWPDSWERPGEVRRFRREAASSMAYGGDPRAVPILSEFLSDPLGRAHGRIVGALAAVDDPAARTLIAAALTHEDSRVRLDAAIALAKGGDSQGGSVLVRSLSPDAWPGWPLSSYPLFAACALAILRDRRALPILAECLNAQNLDVSLLAAESLVTLGEERGRTRLLAGLADPREVVRLKAAAALARGGDGRGRDILAVALSDEHVWEQLGLGYAEARTFRRECAAAWQGLGSS